MRVEFCTFSGRIGKSGVIKLKPIGRARNSVRQPMLSGWDKVTTDLVIRKTYAKGLDGIQDYSHVIVIYWFDKEKRCHLRHHSQGRVDVPYVGIFACRCPQRPNPIGISTVPLVKRRGNILTVKGLDILNGTPVLDVKPYWPVYDEVKKAFVPAWVKKLVF